MADEETRLLAIWANHGRLLHRADLRGRAAGEVLTAVWRRANVLSSCLTCGGAAAAIGCRLRTSGRHRATGRSAAMVSCEV
jgi:hypothetical protein